MAKEERLLLKTLKNRRHSWLGHIIWHNEFVVNILGGAISGKEGRGKTSTTVLNPLPLLFKALLHGQKNCMFFRGHLNG
jgi:hypothetical protein